MRLTRIELRNFRCFESLDLDLDQTTVLVGANDTGKSTVLEAIGLLLNGNAQIDWQSLTRRSAPRSLRQAIGLEEPEPSIVGHLGDMTPSEAEAYGSAAPRGILRLGKAPLPVGGGPFLVIDSDDLGDLISGLDQSLLHQVFGTDDPAALAKLFVGGSPGHRKGSQVWLDTGIWELGVGGSLAAMEALDYANMAIPLGGPLDTSWSPQAVLAPILWRGLAPFRVSTLSGASIRSGCGTLGSRTQRRTQLKTASSKHQLDLCKCSRRSMPPTRRPSLDRPRGIASNGRVKSPAQTSSERCWRTSAPSSSEIPRTEPRSPWTSSPSAQGRGEPSPSLRSTFTETPPCGRLIPTGKHRWLSC